MDTPSATSLIDRLNNWISTSATIKLMVIGILILLLMIPASMIQSLINERSGRQYEAVNEVYSKWGGSQTINGPVLTIPYKKIYRNKDGKVISEKMHYIRFLPEELKISGDLNPETRYRGIFEVVVYNTRLSMSGTFPLVKLDQVDADEILWDQAFVSVGISDLRGIKDIIKIQWKEASAVFEPGISAGGIASSGISSPIPVSWTDTALPPFSFDINLNGSENLFFVPLGKVTEVSLRSDWRDPSFTGAFLPEKREIGNHGFAAQWKVLHLNRNYPQVWNETLHDVADSAFGVTLLVPVEQYQKSTRSVKYAIMFIALTFVFFFLVEVMNGRNIHPIQYILVGLGLCLFYTLLVSLSEHLNFNTAYLISSAATIIMLTLYSKSVFKQKLLTLAMFFVLIGLYGFLFSTLQLQDYSLLIGSLGLFAILSTVMFLSRNFDWYGVKKA